ncbi:hemolysin C [Mycoplasmopsis pullorum]|uniref:CNNM domain-containing protein n=1 Tax=Mycoplasmopsis pullorum TaxID=48003 RepID=UPI001118D1DA|nr:hemolysin family protein [Mycoplasmopsis pullorum]TNK83910.1 hemolysin C [Mycoplasmopsis pullorum]TNK92054.1 hemolysin C [Mycoplasmopsis pullorum]
MSKILLISLFIVVLLFFILSAIFSGAETAYTSISMAKVHTMVENNEARAKLIHKQLKRYNQILTTILIANNIVNIGSATLTSFILNQLIGSGALVTIVTTALVTPILVIFSEIIPKLLGKSHPVKYLQIFGYFIEFIYWVLWIFAYPLGKIGKKVYITNSEDELKKMIEIARNEGVLQSGESLLAQNALDLDSTKVSQHYLRLKDVTTIDYRASVQDALELFKETNYSRIPVVKKYELIGIIMLKDLYHLKRGKIINYIIHVPFISANSVLTSALEKLRRARVQMGFVVENNNSTRVLGIITVEDIIEELVGEIYDETDEAESIFEISLEQSEVHANVKVKDVFKQLDIDDDTLDDEDYELTLGKWMLKMTNKQKLNKNLRFNLDKVASFKVIQSKNKENKVAIIGINKY